MRKPKLQTFVDLETAAARKASSNWTQSSLLLMDEIAQETAAGHYARAHELATMLQISCSDCKGELEIIALNALLLGACQAGDCSPGETTIVRLREIPDAVGNVVAQMEAALQSNATTEIQRQVHAAIEQKAIADPTQPMLAKAEDDLVDLLNLAVAEGKALIDIGANVLTSRMVSYGFLVEATEQGLETYQITAVLDTSTCPVCKGMNGRVFKVDSSLSRLDIAVRTLDPNELKGLTPWPSQSKTSLAELATLSNAQLQERGYGIPPFHPRCRCTLMRVNRNVSQGQFS